MNDWRITSTRKPSKKYINYLKKAAKIQKDMRLKKDKDKANKELTNLLYRATLQDIKDYSKGDFWKGRTLYLKLMNLLDFIAEESPQKYIFTKKGTVRKTFKPKTKTKTVKPKTKTKTVKKTKTTKKTKSKKKKTTSKKKK